MKTLGEWDKTSFLKVSSEFLPLDYEAASRIDAGSHADVPSRKASAIANQYFGGDLFHMAPKISIIPDRRLDISMEYVEEPTEAAKKILNDA